MLCSSVATASATFSPRHASPAPGPSYVTTQDISPSISPSPSPLHLPRPALPSLLHHQQLHDDDILPLPLPCDQNDSPYADSSDPQAQPALAQQLQEQQQQQQQQQQQKGKTHRRRLVGGMQSSHLTVDSEYQCVRLAVLGAPGVGKSAIVTQFVMQTFPEEYVPTEQRQVYNCVVVFVYIIMFGSVWWGGNISKLDSGRLEKIVKMQVMLWRKPLEVLRLYTKRDCTEN